VAEGACAKKGAGTRGTSWGGKEVARQGPAEGECDSGGSVRVIGERRDSGGRRRAREVGAKRVREQADRGLNQ